MKISMLHRSVAAAVLLLAVACTSLDGTPGEGVPTATRGEPVVAFLDIGGVT